MNVKKPTQSQAKNPNLLANHVGYKKYRISSGLGLYALVVMLPTTEFLLFTLMCLNVSTHRRG